MVTNTERIQANNSELRKSIEMAENLPNAGGGEVVEPIIEPLEVTENGTYTAPDGVDGYSPVVVDVPIPDGYIVPNGELEVTENGTHDVTEYASVTVNVPTGDDDAASAIVDRTVTKFINSNVTSIASFAFRGCAKLTTVDAPNAKSVGTYSFYGCSVLASVNLPLITGLGQDAFYQCNKLTSITLPSLATASQNALREVQYAETIDLPKLTAIPVNMFYGCRGLKALILRSPTLVTLANTSAFTNCYCILGTQNSGFNPNGEKIGFIYVPKALLEDYKVATNWSDDSLVTQLRAIEDYPEITGG